MKRGRRPQPFKPLRGILTVFHQGRVNYHEKKGDKNDKKINQINGTCFINPIYADWRRICA